MEVRSVTEICIHVLTHFKSLAVKAGFYGDAGEVVGFFHEVKQISTWMGASWTTRQTLQKTGT